MNNSNNSQPGPTAPDPLIRNLQNGLVATASADLGKSAVTSQIGLLPETDSVEPVTQLDQSYQGVIEINHEDKVTDLADDNSAFTEEQKPIGRQVHNHYIEEPKEPKRTLKELEDLYPNESPLLAPN